LRTQTEASVERYLSVDDLAERYGVAVQTVYQWNHRGTGPRFVKVGRLPRYRLTDIIAWEDSRASGGGEAA
jgi:predicted DNA-binding transcriptional regulator AlpA